ncbi:MAG: hypothetical protein PHU54_05485 [Candidatus Omnitrophica bacterium]|nr:hypothetical protein [Candidatus Omnitrophota bacterium]
MAQHAYLRNSTGGTIVKGTVVKSDSANDLSMVPTAGGDLDPIGVVLENVLPGHQGRIVVAGLAEVLVDNAGATNREDWIGVSATSAGLCTAGALPSPPTDAVHFREVGHTVQGRIGPGLVWAIVHFN